MLKLVDVSKGEQVHLFNNIAIETISWCNRSCGFCPVGEFKRVKEEMPLETIHKIIQELKQLNYKGRIEWYIYDEFLGDKRHLDIIKYCREELPGACQMISTNGDYFKSGADILALFEAGLNQMQINVYNSYDIKGTPEQIKNGRERARERYATLLIWAANLNSKAGIRNDLSVYQNSGPKQRILKVVNKFEVTKSSTDKDVEGPNTWVNRSGNVPSFKPALTEPLNKHCTRVFRFLNINWKGDAILCCNDYYGQTNFGNVKTKSLLDIWNSFEFNVYRLKLQNKKRDCFLCDKCDFMGGYYPHMIDHVTFGDKFHDLAILEQDLTERSSIFKEPALALSEQGIKRG